MNLRSCPAGKKPCCRRPRHQEEYPGSPPTCRPNTWLATQAKDFLITEPFREPYLHASEWLRMGRQHSVDGRRAVAAAPHNFSAPRASLRPSRPAPAWSPALVASGEPIIDRVYHIDRGYGLTKHSRKLQSLGRADITDPRPEERNLAADQQKQLRKICYNQRLPAGGAGRVWPEVTSWPTT